MTDPTSQAGWYPDPLGRHQLRYHNGSAWTADVADDGHRYVDPYGVAPAPAPAAGVHPAGSRPGNRMAVAALTCGLIGLVLAWIPFVVVAGATLGVLAVVFGIVGVRRARSIGHGKGFAITGLVTGAATLALSVVGVVLTVQVYREVEAFIRPGPVTTEITSCRNVDGTARIEGTLTNEDTREHDYTVFVSLPGRRTVVEVDGVAAGATVDWVATVPNDLRSCEPTVDVQGPFPYGVEVDPVDG